MESDCTKEQKWLLIEKYGGVKSLEFDKDCKRLAEGEPLAYVIGWVLFLGLKMYLDSKPLIPRPETEWWTEQLIANVGTYDVPTLKFLDLCAGSGAIGCAALARLPNAKVYFGEIDPTHEATIRKNIRENDLDESRADIRIGDLFNPFTSHLTLPSPIGDGKVKRQQDELFKKWTSDVHFFDIIACNPPYVPQERVLPESVQNFEPALALRAGVDGLSIIRRIIKEASAHLTVGGQLWLECDTEHAESVRQLVEQAGAREAKLRTDQYGRPRLIVAYW
ncbi:MAG: peptide chain release factor N(5)-glutamine methyltransferase [bacterium]|nr:peptide chain release factor N(5)-glutamine methyltransferase [bacterium]